MNSQPDKKKIQFLMSKVEKKKTLEAIGRLIVRNSRGTNLMVESVAKERVHNILMWLESSKLIDEDWRPMDRYLNLKNGVEAMNSSLREILLKVMSGYLSAKTEGFAGHQLGTFVRNEVPKEIDQVISKQVENYLVSGSVGQGNWATVPWIAIMNKMITTSTQRGYYIVYLFSEDMKKLYLTLAQGVTETSRDEMMQVKREIRENIKMSDRIKKDDHIKLGMGSKAKQYALSTAAYIPYTFSEMPSEETLVKDLKEMIQLYEDYIQYRNKKSSNHYNSDINSSQIVREEKSHFADFKSLIEHIHSYIRSKGFYYERAEVMNLFLSLKTKPFVILSGISGTGKTKMVQWFAESLGATEKNGQFALIPIRPDWNDGSDLLGYVDIKGDFKPGPLTAVIRKAEQNPSFPYFVLLDEMNLARVEYYFSDILSIMESRKWQGSEMVSSLLLSEEIAGEAVTLPNNLFIIGTVNMDETTHPFSKKVLDRANTIEFNRVELNNLAFLQKTDEILPIPAQYNQLASRYLHLKDLYQTEPLLIEEVTKELSKINHVLQRTNAHIGYRVRDEICFYMAYNEEDELMSFNQALDHCILQKILPRIAGSDSRVEQVLKDLYQLFTNKKYLEDQGFNTSTESSIYPNSAYKVDEMLRGLREDGFTSFWIS
ncbi:MrcB family domain-containing protein [Lederbergia galactosidilytica]|uniref:MrcB family domain-containing protein n=1 Tax=Lederbergia galactosidilytica TaxID=217031 RepID=UPI0007DB4349|nr:DUF3578 domain-containing protein [Lederbergia galactosidilytica]